MRSKIDQKSKPHRRKLHFSPGDWPTAGHRTWRGVVESGKRGTGRISWIETPNGWAPRGDADRLNFSLAIFLRERFVTGAVPAKHSRLTAFLAARPAMRANSRRKSRNRYLTCPCAGPQEDLKRTSRSKAGTLRLPSSDQRLHSEFLLEFSPERIGTS